MQELVIQKYNDIETVDSRLVAEQLGIEHRALIQLIRTHQESIESNFERVAFEMLPLETAGGVQNLTVAHLSEDQALFIGSLSRNTQKVVEFKSKLVKAFSLARRPKELSKKEILLLALESEERAIAAETKLLEAKPKVDFYDQVADTTTSFDMQEVSAMLKLNYGRNILFKKLRSAKVLMNDNLPYRNLLDDGKFIVVETKWMNHKTEQVTATTQTRITQKGLDWLQRNKEKLGL